MHCRVNQPRGGFSLIELLIVLALMLVLMTMYYGAGSSSHQARMKKNCEQNLLKIYVAMEIYANDNHGKFPQTAGARTSEEVLDVLVPRYTADTAIFICPGSKDSSLPAGESFRKATISYAYYMGRRASDKTEALMSDRQTDTQPKKAGDPVFSTTGKKPGNNHHKYGGNFLFCDGRVEASPILIPFPLALSTNVELLNPRP
jgi:prepilin-type N-terminal cleavage/methylation domain-containing protein/prepilin-type processing-associated H-X9-DG protein